MNDDAEVERTRRASYFWDENPVERYFRLRRSITMMEAGGATSLDNLILVCRRHHRAVHEVGVRLPKRE